MGEKVQVGPLIYNILESEWRSQIGDPPEVRYPKHRFLVLRITVTNSGAAESGIPHLLLEDAKGHSYPEGVEGQAIPEWMGVLRRVKPADTEQGRIYFDVPTGAYRLRVTDDADRGQEKIVVVDIPLRLDAEVPGSTPTLSIPSEPHTK